MSAVAVREKPGHMFVLFNKLQIKATGSSIYQRLEIISLNFIKLHPNQIWNDCHVVIPWLSSLLLHITLLVNLSDYIQTSISIKYDPCAVRIFALNLLFGDCCDCSHAFCRDSSRLCRSTLASMICNLLNTSQTTCSCDSLAALSSCHFCQSSIVGDPWSLISMPWNSRCAPPSMSLALHAFSLLWMKQIKLSCGMFWIDIHL